jgi:pimeloyl-ACP methyl ester carboxylesterase
MQPRLDACLEGANPVTEVALRTSDGLDSTATVHAPAVGQHEWRGPVGKPGAPVILLHGLSQQRRFWDPVVSRMRHAPVVTLDQRGHGASNAGPGADYSIDRCARDVIELAETLSYPAIHVVGHSWGGAVALRVAAAAPDLVESCCLIDGGLSTPSAPIGPGSDPAIRATLLERLRPPALGIPIDEIWAIIAEGMGDAWSDEARAALVPTYSVAQDGTARTMIGLDRHMAVLEGLLDYDPWPDAEAVRRPLWAVFCEPRGAQADESRLRVIERAQRLPTAFVQRWNGALHDVPLQWPALVAGLVDSLIESRSGDCARST